MVLTRAFPRMVQRQIDRSPLRDTFPPIGMWVLTTGTALSHSIYARS